MLAPMSSPFPLRRFLWILFAGALFGAVYTHSQHGAFPVAAAVGAAVGSSIALAIFAVERFVLRRNSGALFGRLPFLPYLALRSALYVAILLGVNELASRLASPDARFVEIKQVDILFSVTLCIAGNLLFSVNELLGPGVLFAFAAGRYYHPRREERMLLFIDMRSSTAIAERLGEERFLGFLNRFVHDVSLAIAAAGGEIHKYVGDEVIATWPLAPGPNGAGCVRACFAALERLAARRADYEREFGSRADFRAGLHCGPLVVGELGYLKKEIALIGDAMNTAARILEACRETGCRVLASATLLERLTALPPGVAARALGSLPMRGKDRALELYALETSGAPRPQPTSRKSFSSSVP
jgi:adenylate cyclase